MLYKIIKSVFFADDVVVAKNLTKEEGDKLLKEYSDNNEDSTYTWYTLKKDHKLNPEDFINKYPYLGSFLSSAQGHEAAIHLMKEYGEYLVKYNQTN